MKKITLLTSISMLVAIAFGCNSPKKDAKEVCDCYKHIVENPKEAENYGFQKCMALSAEKLLKYKGKPKDLIEFNIQLDSCTQDLRITDKSK